MEILKVTKKFKHTLPIYYSSFDLESCILLKNISPKSLVGILIDNFKNFNLQEVLQFTSKYNFFNCGINYNLIKSEIIKKIKEKNLFLSVFYEKNIEYNIALNLWKLGVDSIFSDDPRRILEEN